MEKRGDRVSKTKEIFKKAGLKETRGRVLVLELLSRKKKPMSIEEIGQALRSDSPDKVTLYRMMEQFLNHEIVREVDLKEGFVRFEYQGAHHHHHIVCKSCDRIEHIESDSIEEALSKAGKQSKNFRGKIDHSLEFFGVCNSCQK